MWIASRWPRPEIHRKHMHFWEKWMKIHNVVIRSWMKWCTFCIVKLTKNTHSKHTRTRCHITRSQDERRRRVSVTKYTTERETYSDSTESTTSKNKQKQINEFIFMFMIMSGHKMLSCESGEWQKWRIKEKKKKSKNTIFILSLEWIFRFFFNTQFLFPSGTRFACNNWNVCSAIFEGAERKKNHWKII